LTANSLEFANNLYTLESFIETSSLF
jgi:hypothetical protein